MQTWLKLMTNMKSVRLLLVCQTLYHSLLESCLKCFHSHLTTISSSRSLSERALTESRSDVQEQETRAGDEDGLVQEESLKETHEQVQDMVRMERSELSLIREQCVKDVQSISERGGREWVIWSI